MREPNTRPPHRPRGVVEVRENLGRILAIAMEQNHDIEAFFR